MYLLQWLHNIYSAAVLFTSLNIFHIPYHEIAIMSMLEKDVEIVKFTLVPITGDFPPGDTLKNVLGHF